MLSSELSVSGILVLAMTIHPRDRRRSTSGVFSVAGLKYNETIPIELSTPLTSNESLTLGIPQGGKHIASWDERNRQLGDESTVDRHVYLGTPMCVQVVVPRLEDQRLVKIMKIVDAAVHSKVSKESLSKL